MAGGIFIALTLACKVRSVVRSAASLPTTKDDAKKFRQALIGFASLLGAASAHAIVDTNSHDDNANEFSIA